MNRYNRKTQHKPVASLITAVLLMIVSVTGERTTSEVVEISNTQLPVDTNNNSLVTGEAAVFFHNDDYYLYTNDWGTCADVDCCTYASSTSCASCCFAGIPGDCVYATGHQVRVYKTPDFKTWYDLGIALSKDAYVPGIMFRPHVVYNKASQQFVMWYEDRWVNGTNNGYAVAISSSAEGPFKTIKNSTDMVTDYKIGDFDIFVDQDTDIAYHVRTGVVIEQLNPDYTGVVRKNGSQTVVTDNDDVEGPVMFKRGQVYYVLVGQGCCACKGGSNILVFSSDQPLGNYTYQGDIGSNTTQGHVFKSDSPYNYVTRAQGSDVVVIGGNNSESAQFLWVGNAWVTSTANGSPRDKDLLYWTVLNFEEDGKIQQVVRNDTIQVYVPV